MQSAKEVRRRIKSVDNTKQITKTMEMVATSKLKRATDRVRAARPYSDALGVVVKSLYAPEFAERFPVLRQPERDPEGGHRPHDGQPGSLRGLQRQPDP